MTSKGPIDCVFYFEGVAIARHALHVVPSVGEIVMLTKYLIDKKQTPFVVRGRIFQTAGAAHNRQLVFFYMEESS